MRDILFDMTDDLIVDKRTVRVIDGAVSCDEEFRGWCLGVCFCEVVVEFLVGFYYVEDALAGVEAGDLDYVFVCRR